MAWNKSLGSGFRLAAGPRLGHNAGMTAAARPQPCVFCEIIAGRSESSQVYQDGLVVAFLDIRPLTPGHLLVVPREHAAGLDDLDEGLGAQMFTVAHRLARALRRSGLPCEGVNMFLADGAAAGQEMFHVHLHVIPRNPGDGFRLKARRRTPGRDELDAQAASVRHGVTGMPGG
jgi:diadenosine tetraphosphate (Ap4A) HIT family hydrolase